MDYNLIPYVPGTFSAADVFPSTLALADPFYGGLTTYGGINPRALQARVKHTPYVTPLLNDTLLIIYDITTHLSRYAHY